MASEKAPGAAKADKKKGEKTKRPSAQKRNLQSEKRRLSNRSFRSSVNTAIRSLEGALAQKEEVEKIKLRLNEIYSIVDKGVKRGVFKSQKAARTKSRLSARCAKV
jgi:small subunit ribosomal protein S20